MFYKFRKKTSVDLAIPFKRIARYIQHCSNRQPVYLGGNQGALSAHVTFLLFSARKYESTSSISDTYHLADYAIINTLYIIMKLLTKHNRKCIADRLFSWMFGHYLGFYFIVPITLDILLVLRPLVVL